jgi:dihydrofolate synthase/folylpolyglutamate synthase
MTYRETIDFLCSLRVFGIKLGLENMERLLERLGRPHNGLRFIHIAGTNGKGSVAAMLAATYQEAGYRTGLYTSPHLVSFCERIQVNREMIREMDVVRLIERLRPELSKVEGMQGHRHPTFFEVVTALALLYFQEQKVDIVIWETGLGGRLDATNVVTPLVSVITNIHWDHQTYLGNTLEDIAKEKAGIIKPGIPVVTATTELEALEVIEETCEERKSPLTRVGIDVRVHQLDEDLQGQDIELHGTKAHYGVLELPLLGAHQAINAATAVVAVEAAGVEAPVPGCVAGDVESSGKPGQPRTAATTPPTLDHVRQGLRHAHWPGRFQLVQSTHPRVVLDGAHNIAGVVELKSTLIKHFPDAHFIFIVGILKDKNYPVMCAEIANLADVLFAVQVKNERSADPVELARVCRGLNPKAEVEAQLHLTEAYERARHYAASIPHALIVITGSLFLVGEAMHRLPLGLKEKRGQGAELTLQ